MHIIAIGGSDAGINAALRARELDARSDVTVHLLHSMGDTFAVMRTLEETAPSSALIVGASYIGREMAEALVSRGLAVAQMEQPPEVLPTVDPEIGALVHGQLAEHGVEVLTGTTVRSVSRATGGQRGRLVVGACTADGQDVARVVDMVLVVVGVRPDADLAASAGIAPSPSGPRPTTTRPTTRVAAASTCATAAISGRAGFSAYSSSATATGKLPSGSTSPPPRFSTR